MNIAAAAAIVAIFAMLIVFNSHNSFAQEPLCDYKAEVLLNGTEFEKQGLKWRVKATRLVGMPTNITGTAVIRDLSGEGIKLYRIWSSVPISKLKTSNERTADLEEGNEYTLTAEINVKCNDTNRSNNIDTKRIKIKGEKMENVISLNTNAQKSQSSCVAYESAGESSKKIIMGFLLALSILLNAVLIWKR